jgi:hypothetical protein
MRKITQVTADQDSQTTVTLPNTSSYSLGAVDYAWATNIDTNIDTLTHSYDSDLTITRPGKPPLKVADTLEQIMERLSIIEPDFDKMDRYPALREAYNNYKTIEALLTEDVKRG